MKSSGFDYFADISNCKGECGYEDAPPVVIIQLAATRGVFLFS